MLARTPTEGAGLRLGRRRLHVAVSLRGSWGGLRSSPGIPEAQPFGSIRAELCSPPNPTLGIGSVLSGTRPSSSQSRTSWVPYSGL